MQFCKQSDIFSEDLQKYFLQQYININITTTTITMTLVNINKHPN